MTAADLVLLLNGVVLGYVAGANITRPLGRVPGVTGVLMWMVMTGMI